ncbi:MAG: hypothetical protein IKQ41_06975 [Clostridia bacterium]|nr:hypothetical protein [Clostridia bacterium]
MDELKRYCVQKGLRPRQMRFFIGEDYKKPRAFGIYQDGKDFVVYKNKADGTRTIHYKAPYEAQAVNELYQKLLSECNKRGIYPNETSGARSNSSTYRVQSQINSGSPKRGARSGESGKLGIIIILIIAFAVFMGIGYATGTKNTDSGYHKLPSSYYQNKNDAERGNETWDPGDGGDAWDPGDTDWGSDW